MSRGLVLNIDSDPGARTKISLALRNAGIEVHEFGSAEEALRLGVELAPRVVIVGPQVGEIRGEDICRTWPKESPCATILRTPSAIRITEPLPEGPDAYLSEPVHPFILKNLVGNLMCLGEAEQQIADLRRDAENTREEFHSCLARASHDLSESVRASSTFVDLLRSGGEDRLSPAERRYLEQVAEATSRARILLKYLSSYVQASREPITAHRDVDLKGVVLAAEAQQRAEIERAGATIRVDDLPVVRGNPARLQQLIGGLLSNSLKYRNPDKPLHIVIQAARDAGGRWVISVADNGVGMEAQHHEAIFAPFHRLHGRDIPGTGMGLALGRRIVEAHGGTLRVKSAPGQGATFLFSLPAAD